MKHNKRDINQSVLETFSDWHRLMVTLCNVIKSYVDEGQSAEYILKYLQEQRDCFSYDVKEAQKRLDESKQKK